MPELPEIETLRIQLIDLIIGLTIKNIEILKNKSFIGDPGYVAGVKITEIRRFAKMLVIDLSNRLSLVVHLKMSGQLIFRSKKLEVRSKKEMKLIDSSLINLPNKHTRVVIIFTDGSRLYFNDMRMFGWIKIAQNSLLRQGYGGQAKLKTQNHNLKVKTVEEIVGKLGPDALNQLDKEKFFQILHSSKKQIKLVLMDQGKIAGVGNIYANECLFMTRISPKMRASQITMMKSNELLKNLMKVLKEGIRWGGASSNLFINSYGKKGRMQDHLLVYGKKEEPCPNYCGEKILKAKLGGRGTYFCPRCQDVRHPLYN